MYCFLGNKLTLQTKPQELGIDVREELLKFHSRHYSANLMCLVVLGKGESAGTYIPVCLNLVLVPSHVNGVVTELGQGPLKDVSGKEARVETINYE